MATDLKILGWSSKGLRCPDHEFSFENEKGVYRITLLQMPNGTGKTTTLRLLRAALAGPEIWDGNFEKVKQFRKNADLTNGNFTLRLSHNGRRLTIEMQFDFQNEDVKYTTTNIGGKESGFRPPADLRPFLSIEFVKLLVFDGELAAQLLDSNHTNAQKAIEEMYQLSYFSKMKDRVDEYWNEMAQSHGSKGGTKELSRRRGRVEALQDRYNYVKSCQGDDNKKVAALKSTLKQLNEEFKQQIAKSKQDSLDLAKAQASLSEIRRALSTKVKDMAILIKNPIEFSQEIAVSIYSLKENLDKAKLPGVAAREFFDEIAEEPFCICGREIDEAIKIAIRTGAKKYLGSEEMNVLNAMKTDIRNRFPTGEINSGMTVRDFLKQVEDLQEKEILAQQNLDIVKIKAGDNNPEIGKIQDKINSLNKSYGELENEMLKYEEYDDSDESWNLDILAKRKAKAEEDLADATDTMELKKKKDILNAVLEKAFRKSLHLLSEHICDEANAKIKKIMPYNNISIDTIDRSLRLVGKEGGSVGETLSVGYAFLSSLLSNTEQNLPSIVDSPSGPIDLQIRPEIGRLIPSLSDQFIAFTISSERQNFMDPLIKEAKEPPFLVTLFKKGDLQMESTAKRTNDYKESSDGIWVFGKDFFQQFHTETE